MSGLRPFAGGRRRLAAAAALVLLAGLIGRVWHHARLVAPDPTLLLRDRHGLFLGEAGAHGAMGAGYWPLTEIPPRVAAATLAIEDRRFWRHPGVDPEAVVRAALQNLRHHRRISGASTIAMQIARLQRPGPRTYFRKALEALDALALTARNGRREVLGHYLRIVPYGNRIHGIVYAARRYLDKPISDLSWAEVAFLCAIPQAPARMNPLRPAGRLGAIRRGKGILRALREQGVISGVEYRLALRQIAAIRVPAWQRRPAEALHAVLALEERLVPRRRGMPSIVDTSLDLDIQRRVARITADEVDRLRTRGAGNAAVIVLDRRTRAVLAWVGSADYFDKRHAGAIDFARIARSPGSTLKPFLYGLALERGIITPATILDDLRRGAGGISNSDGRFLGPLLPRVALANSRNVPATNLLAAIGLERGYAFLGRLGLQYGSGPAEHWGLGLAIGGMPVTLERLVRAYTVMAGDGRLGELVWYRGQPVPPPVRVLSESTVREITLFLSDPMARLPTFPRMGALEYPFPVAVKTGTSSGYHDAWTVAWSRRFLVGAWVGDPGFLPMNGLSGYRSAARLVHRVLLDLHGGGDGGLTNVGFPPPRGWTTVRLCALSGRLATLACDHVVLERLPESLLPTEHCRAHVAALVDTRNGLLASNRVPPRHRAERIFVELPPRYAAWQAASGLPRLPERVSLLDIGLPGARFTADPGGRPFPVVEHSTRLLVTSPPDGITVLRDPETPPGLSSLRLTATVAPSASQVVWYVDGAPYRMARSPYTTRWPLSPGQHTFQLRDPSTGARSTTVRITVY